jgi:coenzyme PQQ synthesis protein D (PqqD)
MRIEKSSQTVFTPLADGTGVLLNLDTLFYFSLNRTGSALWQQIEASNVLSLDDLLRSACETFDVDEPAARPLIGEFIERLEQFKMIRTS